MSEPVDSFALRMASLRTGKQESEGIEDKAFFLLGQLASTCEGDEARWNANISACCALGAEHRYGEVPVWADIPEEQREPIVQVLRNHDCENALARLEELS